MEKINLQHVQVPNDMVDHNLTIYDQLIYATIKRFQTGVIKNPKVSLKQICDLKRRFREYKNWKKCCKSQVALYAAFEKYGYEKATFTTIYESSDVRPKNSR